MTKLVPLLAIMALLMGLPSVAHAQTTTTPTVSSVAITSSPSTDNTYATGNTVTVSLTFSEAVTVTGTPHVVVDIGGQPRNFKYSGDGSTAAAQPFSYTVLVGDKDADGVSLLVNSLTLNGGTIQATDDSTNATLTHAAMTFANHKVDTQVTLLSNLGQADASDTINVSATESAKIEIVVAQDKAFDINAITLDVRTPSETLNVTVRLFGGDFADYTYTGSVTAAGLQTFTLSGPPGVSFGNVGWADFGQTYRYQMIVSGSGAGSVELVGTTGTGTDAGGVSGLSIRAVRGEASNPQMRLSGHEGAIPNLMYGDVLSSPPDGTAYAAGDRIAFLFVFSRPVDFPQGITVPFWLGNGAEDRREASLIENLSGYYEDLFFSYTVQPGDTDSDGIFLGADPLGDNAGIDFHTEETAAVPAYLRLAANQLAASQSVNGSGSRTCEEVFCSTVLVGEERVGLEAAIGFSISVNANALPFVPLGASSALSFGYGGEEYVVRELVFLDQAIAALDLRFQNGLPSSHYDRLTLSVDGTLFLLSEASSSSVAVRFQWSDPVLPWAAGDEIDVKLIETATATFDAASYAKTEGDTFEVTVTLGDPFANTLTLPIEVAENGGADATDYTGIPENLVFAPGETVKTFTVTIEDDDFNDDDESLTLSFGEESHIRSGGANETATITITDTDGPQVSVSFGAGTYTVPEGGTQSVTVSLSADPERTVEIRLTHMPQGGAGSTDYSGVPANLTFNAGETEKSFIFTSAQDMEDDDDESVLLGFGTPLPLGVTAGTTSQTTVSITDDDVPQVTVMFLESAYNVPEGGTQSVTVSLSADPERTVEIHLTHMPQGGAGSTDYSGVPANLTFNAGETEKSFIFTSAQDMEDDDDESVLLGFGTLPSMVSAGTPATTTVSITDNDFPEVTVMFGADAYTVLEGGTQSVAVTLSADPERTVVIPLTTMPQGGAGSTDYSGVPANLTFNAGETEKSFVFTSAQDTEDDDDESVLLGFGANLPIRITQGVTNEATVSITDDDDPQVSVSFGAGTYTVPEGGTQSVTVSLSADPERTVEIRLTHMPQGGAGSTDYSGVPANLTFNAGETEKSFVFTSAQDMEDDDDESVLLAFGTPLPPGVTAGTTSQTTVSITDDDVPQVTVMFLESAYNVPEGGTQSVTVSLSADPERTVEIRLTHMPQGGAGSTDYSGVPANLTFNAGETEKSFIFTSAQDMEDDDDESVLLGFGTLPSMVSAGTPATTTVSITDNDFPEVTVMFGADAYTVLEGGTQSVAVTLSADPERTVVIPLTTMPQGGAGSTDYSGVPANLTFNAGETEQTITFSATHDTEDDDDESVLLGFGANLPIRITQGVANEATVSITDDDDPQVTVSFGAGTYTVPEGGTQLVTVNLSADPERTVVIPLTTMPQGGAGSTDYSVPLSVTFNTGEMSKTITFNATHDTEDDDDESVLLAFGANLPSRVIQGAPNEATVRITDDDDPEVTVMFAQMAYTVPEGGTQSVTVNLSADPERTVVIPLTTMNQGGVDATDYSVPTSVTFNSGQMSKTIMFSATHDTVDDDDESVKMAIGTPLPSRVTQGAPNEATVTITDDDDPFVEVQFAQNSYTVPEGGTQAVTVTLRADPERTVDIPLVATAQGGADITDYSVPLGVIFNSGELSKTITFSATHDTVDDDNESVRLAIGAILPARVSRGATNETTVSIADDDDPHVTVMFAQAGYRVVEGDAVAVRVTLSADPERTVTIPLVATGQVGATTDDYSGVPEDLTINAGETSKTFEFMATADETSDTGESVKISFGTSLPSRVTEGTPNEATVTIKQVSTQFSLDCTGTAAAWCADVGFSDQTAENWGRANLRYGRGLDPEASLSDDVFRFRGVDYTVLSMELRPGTHPIMPNAWSRWQQGYSSFRIVINWGPSLRGDPAEEHYRDWVLHLDGLELPFKDAFVYRNNFTWVGAEFQQIFNDWIPSTVTKIGIEEVEAADQNTNPLLPWAPMQVDATPEGPNGLRINWAKPAWYTPGLNLPGLPEPTKYIVQWKLASVGWGDSAAVSQREVADGSHFHSLTVDGLTEDALYSVRVIAGNDAGDGPPSEETLGRPQDGVIALLAKTVNGRTLTLRFSERLDPNAVPAETDFVVIVDGGLIAVDSVAISGDAVTLTLDRAVTAANSVLVRYDKPTDPSAVFLRDTGGDHVQISQHLELLSAVNATPQTSVQPLTATFANMPSSHDGATLFTFEIEFSEPVWVGVGLPRDDMLEITGGTVISAPWKNRRSDKVNVHVRPDTTGDIVIVLPGNRVCAGIIGSGDPPDDPVAGAPCAIGNRVLTNEPTATIPGPSSSGNQVVENTPAEGEPRIDGIPELGQTLSVDTTAIADVDGLDHVVFQHQWLADDADIAGSTGATYTVVSGDVGKAISVRVSFTDDGGNEETLTSAPTVVTAAGLQLQSATVDVVTLMLTYSEVLDNGVTLGTTPFAVNVNGSPRSLSGVAVGGSNVLLLLSSAVEAGDTVTVDYTAPNGQDFIRDTLGRKASSFSGQAVTNDTASAPLTASAHNVPSSHDGSSTFTFELRFSEELPISYKILRDHAFTVTGGEVVRAKRLERGKNVRWEITVRPDSNGAVTIVLPATTDCAAGGAICTGDGRKLSGGLEITVNGPGG